MNAIRSVVAFFGHPPKAATCDKVTMPIVTVLTSGNIVGIVFRMEYDDPRKSGAKYTTISYESSTAERTSTGILRCCRRRKGASTAAAVRAALEDLLGRRRAGRG